jgi:ABC-2 type transport system ATP-binding protein
MSSPAIDLCDVAKTYGRKVQALRGIRMCVMPGEIFGLLGPNGAGKTTLVKIMMGVVRPTRAQGTLLGRPLGHKPTLARVGYLPEHHRMPLYLTGRQALEFFAALTRVDRPTRRRRAAELLELVRMKKWSDVRLRTYSKGMQQRIALAQALMNDPDLVVLDEPTDGLDPVGRKETRDVLQQLRAEGKTIFLNSHLLGEVEQLCDRVAILAEGNVVRQGTIAEMTAGSAHYLIELAGDDRGSTQAAVRAALPCELILVADAAGTTPNHRQPVESGTLPSGEAVELSGTTLRIATGDARRIQPILDALRAGNLVIQAVRPLRQSLEDYFMQAVSGAMPPVAARPTGGQP